jgi:uncharacterized membrane protein
MFIRVNDSQVRSVSKAVSWRLVGSIDTFVIAFLMTGNVVAAGSIASLETVSKVILYYLHERAWSRVPLDGKPALPACGEHDLARPPANTAAALQQGTSP